ncbi:MAG: IMP dehydrogenase [Candidatus Levybacteria bacterium]|nr:IMP dehydrogenase [Candidatus Levybacteria bacterium]
MEDVEHHFPQGLTFDDVLLTPGYTDFSRSDISLSTKFTKTITLDIPFVSSPMDTVTESTLAIALAKMGGIGIIHRNLSVESQADEVATVKKANLLVGAAIGVSAGFEERAEALMAAKVDVLVMDSAHGYTKTMIDAIKHVKNKYASLQIIAGNIATFDGAKGLIEAGADALRVGMGPGAICTTRIVSGMGVPQVTAILETHRAAKKYGVPVIADGGLKYSGDMVKALAAGASAVMMGSFFASTFEAPGRIVTLKREFVPKRFLSVFGGEEKKLLESKEHQTEKDIEQVEESIEGEIYQFKEYRGMGSEGAMKKGADVKSEDEYHGKSYKDKVLVAEGVEGFVPIKGSVQDVLEQAIGGIKSGMFYVGAKTLEELQAKAKFIQLTQASLTESHPHDVLVTNPGKSYSG